MHIFCVSLSNIFFGLYIFFWATRLCYVTTKKFCLVATWRPQKKVNFGPCTYTGMYHHLNPLIRSAALYKKTMQHLLMPTQMYQIILLCGYSNYARKLAWVHSFGMISQIMVHQRNCQTLFPEWIQRFL